MYQNINLNALKYFYEVARIKNITKASQLLLVSQPALTKSLKQLETELNTKLFLRSKKGVSLTSEGEILFQYVEKMFYHFSSTMNTIEHVKKKGGTLYIGATTTNFLELIQNALQQFKKMYPLVHIDIVLETIDVLEQRAKLGKLDILVKNDYEYFKSFEIIETFDITDKFIASKHAFPDLEKKQISLETLLKYPFVLLGNVSHGRKNFNTYLISKGIHFQPTYEFNSYSLCRELIRNGFGIGIGNPIHYHGNEFIILDTDFCLPKRTFQIGYIKESTNPLIPDFMELQKRE